MRCPQCSTDNPEEAKFCMNCGKPFSIGCSRCGKQNLPQAKFCINCGQQLSNSSQNKNEDSFESYIPKEYVEKLRKVREYQNIEGERRIVTILFCDIKGSTAMAENLDPEEWTEIMNEAFEFLISPIYKYEGTLARIMGDSILAFFGAPIAHEDDPRRAILAGLDILNGIQPFRKRVGSNFGLDFNVRIGINTGLVVVGGVGSDLFMEYSALGDAINIASRMEQTAQPGTIQIAENTYRQVMSFFEFEEILDLNIKGKTSPVKVYKIISKKNVVDLNGNIAGIGTNSIGRIEESVQFERVISDVLKGRGQIVSLIGEAGLGKTRLLQEVREKWVSSGFGFHPLGSIPYRWNQVMGISYESNQPYKLIQRMIRNFIGVTTADAPDSVRDALERTLSSSGIEYSQDTRILFETILGVNEQTNGYQLEGEELKKAIYEKFVGILDFLVQQKPTVIAIDDLQWSDQASAELIVHLFQLADRLPILFLCSFRPDKNSPAWLIKQSAETQYAYRYTEINLSPLSAENSRILVDSLVDTELPQEIKNLILTKTEGNPFFIEEVIRTLVEKNLAFQDAGTGNLLGQNEIRNIAIPDNLQTFLSARIDRLEETAKHVLQLASVIGRSFIHQVLEIIIDDNYDLDRELNNLQRLGFIFETSREPYLEYMFRQALTHETAYKTILFKNRKEYHKKIGDALLHLYGDRATEYSALLGQHFYKARDTRALNFLIQEGDSAFRLYANQEAVRFYSQAIEVAMWEESPDIEQLLYLFSSRGRAYELNSRFLQASENYIEMQDTAKRFNSKSMELAALVARAQLHSIPNDIFNLEQGMTLIKEAQSMAESQNNQIMLAKIYWITTNLLRFYSSFVDAQKVGEKAISLARDLGLEEQLAYSLTDTAHTYNFNGQVFRAKEISLEAVELWRKIGNQPMLADSLGGLAAIFTLIGDFDSAYKYSDASYEISIKIENLWGRSYSRYIIGLVDFERGNIDLAFEHLLQSKEDAINSKFLAGVLLTNSFLAVLYSELGLFQEALDAIDRVQHEQMDKTEMLRTLKIGPQLLTWSKAGKVKEAMELVEESKKVIGKMNFISKQYYLLGLAYLKFAKSDYHGVIVQAQDTFDYFNENGVKFHNSELQLIKGKANILLGDVEAAEQNLNIAREVASSHGLIKNLWQIDYSLGLCFEKQGKIDDSDYYFSKARESLDYILEHISDDVIKSTFINRNDVKKLLEFQKNPA